MKITQFTDFSLRMLLHLVHHRDRLVTVREVAEVYDISAEHLKKIVRHLAELGHIATVRGKNGGLRLAREPEDINLGQLFRAEENMAVLPCFENAGACPIGQCKLRVVVEDATAAFLAVLDAKTLRDLV